MKSAILTAAVVLALGITAFSCTCVSADPAIPACQELKSKAKNLFVGRVEHVGSKAILLPPDSHAFKMQVITFKVLETFGDSKPATLEVMDWPPGNGSCGYRFVEGESYLVDVTAGSGNEWQVNSCGDTARLEDVEDSLRFLRSTIRSKGATLFGTAKAYVGERNFVAKQNKPIVGGKIIVESAQGSRVLQTDIDGWYMLRELHAGNYVVRLDAGPGYGPSHSNEIEIQRDGCAQVDFRTDRTKSAH